jgi:hypothetical protein
MRDTNFDVLLTVHLSIFILVFNQLDTQNFCFRISLFHASTCFQHHVPTTRRSKLYYTAAGIITPIGGHPVHMLREDLLYFFICYDSGSLDCDAVGSGRAFRGTQCIHLYD